MFIRIYLNFTSVYRVILTIGNEQGNLGSAVSDSNVQLRLSGL